MKTLRAAVTITLLTALILGGAYPALVTGLARLLFPSKAGGSLIVRDDKVVGSALIGQAFSSEKYFHGRPSAAGKDGYDAAGSSGSNLGPTSKALAERLATDRLAIEKLDGASPPVDLLTASGSGLDPQISPAAARYQAPRIARVRGLDAAKVEALITAHTDGRTLGLLGEPRVNVLLLNLALDQTH